MVSQETWVTTVGGTSGHPEASHEAAENLSGGGFSYVFPGPQYQFDAMDEYLDALGDHYASHFKCARCRALKEHGERS